MVLGVFYFEKKSWEPLSIGVKYFLKAIFSLCCIFLEGGVRLCGSCSVRNLPNVIRLGLKPEPPVLQESSSLVLKTNDVFTVLKPMRT